MISFFTLEMLVYPSSRLRLYRVGVVSSRMALLPLFILGLFLRPCCLPNLVDYYFELTL